MKKLNNYSRMGCLPIALGLFVLFLISAGLRLLFGRELVYYDADMGEDVYSFTDMLTSGVIMVVVAAIFDFIIGKR